MNEAPPPRQKFIVAINHAAVDGEAVLMVESEHSEPGDAHAEAQRLAKLHVDNGTTVETYRRMGTYSAEVKVNHHPDGG